MLQFQHRSRSACRFCALFVCRLTKLYLIYMNGAGSALALRRYAALCRMLDSNSGYVHRSVCSVEAWQPLQWSKSASRCNLVAAHVRRHVCIPIHILLSMYTLA